jgi:sulfate permease, SulP family
MVALLEARKAGLFARQHWTRNILSGVIVGVVALPLAMAFAIASGAKPEQGLYTAIVAGFLVSALGGSRVQIAGPTGAFIVILAGITAKHGIDGLQIATMMAGVMLLLLGVARLGALLKFIPDPVIVGFTAGIGIIIFVSQWQYFFGLPAVGGEHFHDKLWHLAHALPGLHPATTVVAIVSFLLVIYTARLPGMARVPGPLAALVLATVAQAAFGFDGVATIGSAFGGIPQGLPVPQFPAVTASRVIELLGPAFAIAMLGAIESLLSAVVADGMAGTRHNSNQELVGQGIANIAAPLFGGFAATGAIARTATNVRSGGNSPLSGMVHAATLLLIALLLAPLAFHIPLATLAAILFVVAWNMSAAGHVVKMLRRAPRADAVILLVTLLLTVFADLVVAVNIGVLLAMMQFLRRMASSVEVRKEAGEAIPAGVAVYAVDGPLFFGAVDALDRALAAERAAPRVLILRLRWVPFIDATGLQSLEEAIDDLHRRGVRVIISGANDRVRDKLANAGILERVGAGNCFPDFEQALAAAK